ncbi:hypothetical protein ACA910_022237 [Epithemia clementina (nom. ined.)]
MHPPQQQEVEEEEVSLEEDWEEWDGKSPFWIHCAAGSLAGVVEHTAVYPLDTVRTHIQVCASCVHRHALQQHHHHPHHQQLHSVSRAAAGPTTQMASSALRGLVTTATTTAHHHYHKLPTGFWQTMRFLMNEPLAVGVAPPASTSLNAAAAAATPTNTALWSEVAGMTRLWRGVQVILLGCIPAHALYFSSYEMVKTACATTTTSSSSNSSSNNNARGGTPTTTTVTTAWWGSSLAGAAAAMGHDVVMTPLDTIKQRMQLGHYTSASTALTEIQELTRSLPSWQTVLLASSVAGFTASALTTPLDRIKTALQTQTLAPACLMNPAEPCKKGASHVAALLAHDNWQQAARFIWQTEGWRGFCRGFWPRVLSHTPAVAISWTTYETAKQALLQQYQY